MKSEPKRKTPQFVYYSIQLEEKLFFPPSRSRLNTGNERTIDNELVKKGTREISKKGFETNKKKSYMQLKA